MIAVDTQPVNQIPNVNAGRQTARVNLNTAHSQPQRYVVIGKQTNATATIKAQASNTQGSVFDRLGPKATKRTEPISKVLDSGIDTGRRTTLLDNAQCEYGVWEATTRVDSAPHASSTNRRQSSPTESNRAKPLENVTNSGGQTAFQYVTNYGHDGRRRADAFAGADLNSCSATCSVFERLGPKHSPNKPVDVTNSGGQTAFHDVTNYGNDDNLWAVSTPTAQDAMHCTVQCNTLQCIHLQILY